MRNKKSIPIILPLFSVFILISLACAVPGYETLEPGTESVVCATCVPNLECEINLLVQTQMAAISTENAQLEPSATPLPTSTPMPLPTATVVPPENVYQFLVQPGSPAYIPNVYYLDRGNAWLGIGGQVFGSDGLPLEFIVVRVQGQLEGQLIDLTSMTGVAGHYGPGGYELQLSDRGIDSIGTLNITLFDLSGNQISEVIPFDTRSNPDELHIIMNFMIR